MQKDIKDVRCDIMDLASQLALKIRTRTKDMLYIQGIHQKFYF
jgi:hypothetical protein